MLRQVIEDPNVASDYKMNADVNLARIFATVGQSQRAFVMINDDQNSFDAEQGDGEYDSVKVPESDANFTWIKACALDGLGQHDKALGLMAAIVPTPEVNYEGSIGAEARLNGYTCMNDSTDLAREFASQLADPPPGGSIFLAIQPEGSSRSQERSTVGKAVQMAVVLKAMVGKARLLPPQFYPALHSWNASPTLDGAPSPQ